MAPQENTGASPLGFYEQKLNTFDFSKIPEARAAKQIDKLFRYRDSVINFYTKVKPELFESGRIGDSNTPKDMLVGHVEKSILRRQAIENGLLHPQELEELNPDEHKRISSLSRDELIKMLETEADNLFNLSLNKDTLGKKIKLANTEEEISVADILRFAVNDEVSEQAVTIKWRDQFSM